MELVAQQFLQSIRNRLISLQVDPSRVLNMDQTPVWYSMDPRTSIDEIGTRTVNIRTSSASTQRVTVAVTVTGGGMMLKPTVIFKGKRSATARIPRKFGSMNPFAHYTVQANAWMDQHVMYEWIEKV